MKVNPWAFPLLAAIATGVWITSQKRTAAVLEREIVVIEKRIVQARAMMESGAESGGADGTAVGSGGSIDWKSISAKVASVQGEGMPDLRVMMRLQKILLDLPAEEILAHLDEIAGLDIEPAVRRQLQSTIIGILAEKDPQMALEHMAGMLGDESSGMDWHLNTALRRWADKDPAAAASWLDRQIAAGKLESKSLDGKNHQLNRYQGSLISAMLKQDPAAATARVAAMDDSQRASLFEQGFVFQIGKQNSEAYAKLVRDTMPPEKVGGILANSASWLAMGDGYEKVDDYISSIHATDGEKAPIVEKVMSQKLTRHDSGELTISAVDEVRAWAMKQAPGVVDKATGEAIAAKLWQQADPDKITGLVLHYHEAGSGDEVLKAFLKSGSVRNLGKEKTTELIDRIRDPALRDEIRGLPQFNHP